MYRKVELKNKKFDKKNDTSTSQSNEFPLPLVNAKHGDNGIMFYGRPEIFDSAEMTIDIVQNGQIATADVYPQPQRTGVLWDAYLIKAKSHSDTERTLCYVATAIYKVIKPKYSYDKKAYWKHVKEEEILLPVKPDDSASPDLTYMDEFIRVLETERINALETWLGAAGFKDTNLTKDEEDAILALETATMQDFRIGGDKGLFDICTPIRRFNANSVTFAGEHPYVVRTSQNNGQRGCIIEDEKYLCEGKTISFGQDTATIFYQEKQYFTGDKIKVMKFKRCEIDEKLALFLLTAMRKSFANFKWGSSSFDENILKNVIVSLPITSNNEIDYKLIVSYIRAVMKKSIVDVISWKDREIAATR